MRVTVRHGGNGAAIRLPSTVMWAARLELDAPVEVHEGDGRVVIELVRGAEVTPAALLAGITEDNAHGEVGAGPARGDEAL